MIIDCHGHYTTAPKALEDWRNRQVASLNDPSNAPRASELAMTTCANRSSKTSSRKCASADPT